jgi:hypothetical protein
MFRSNSLFPFSGWKNVVGMYDEGIVLKILDTQKYPLTSTRIYGVTFHYTVTFIVTAVATSQFTCMLLYSKINFFVKFK